MASGDVLQRPFPQRLTVDQVTPTLAANDSYVRPSVARSSLVISAKSLSFHLLIELFPAFAMQSPRPTDLGTVLTIRVYYRTGRCAVKYFSEGLVGQGQGGPQAVRQAGARVLDLLPRPDVLVRVGVGRDVGTVIQRAAPR